MIIMIFSDLTIRISAENGPRVYYLTLYTWTVLYAKSLKNTRLGGVEPRPYAKRWKLHVWAERHTHPATERSRTVPYGVSSLKYRTRSARIL